MFTENELVRVAKRENNNKRKYLVVNRLQGKHVPIEPSKTIQMFDELAGKIKESYQNERLLLIGFAETATAIGARLAVQADSWYMQTTRENIKNVEYLYFSESHSHATEQKLVKDDLDAIIDEIDRIVFVEDEVTTGNTIMQIIEIIRKTYSSKIQFSVACLLNGMDEEHADAYKVQNIDVQYLVKTDHSKYTEQAEKYEENGVYYNDSGDLCNQELDIVNIYGRMDGRRLVRGGKYEEACSGLWENIRERGVLNDGDSVLVIGTEEFMYPAIYVAHQIELSGCKVKCHSTTRSPIAVSSDADYPLHCRYALKSLYDVDRNTFIYDIGRYDKVLILTDAMPCERDSMNDLIGAIAGNENENIYMFRWCE